MAKKKTKRRFRLLIYHRLGQRWRVAPLLTAVLGGILYGLAWMASRSMLAGLNVALLQSLWRSRVLLLGMIGFSVALYILTIFISRGSYVEVRPKALRIRAGLIAQDISYGRIRLVRSVGLRSVYPLEALKARDRGLLEPLMDYGCTAVDMRSWPRQPIKKLWHKFMFTGDGSSLLFIVEDALEFNQLLSSVMDVRQARIKASQQAAHRR
jgi:hypothetical protein